MRETSSASGVCRTSRPGEGGTASGPGEELPRAFVPTADGASPQGPQKWIGALSGTLFESEWQNGFPMLTVHIQAEIPLQIKELMRDEDTLKLHAELFDLAFRMALDGQAPGVDLDRHALGLGHIGQFLRRTHGSLTASLESTRRVMEPGGENARKMRRTERSLAVIARIADRLEALADRAPAPIACAIRAGDPSPHWH